MFFLPPGTSVIQVTATDADDSTYGNSAKVVYSILEGQPYFSVDPETGLRAVFLLEQCDVSDGDLIKTGTLGRMVLISKQAQKKQKVLAPGNQTGTFSTNGSSDLKRVDLLLSDEEDFQPRSGGSPQTQPLATFNH